MLTSDHAPMLGSLTPERWGKTHMRHNRPTGHWNTLQVRAARKAERLLVAADLADLACNDERDRSIRFEPAQATDTESFVDECMCRRCLLHDDPGGCLNAEDRWFESMGLPPEANYADLLALVRTSTDENDDLFDFMVENDLAHLDFASSVDGDFDTLCPDDLQWGFTVSSMDKAPGVTSGRPIPTSLNA